MHSRRVPWVTAVMVLALGASLAADRVRLRSGKVITGMFMGGDSKSVRVLLDNGQVVPVIDDDQAGMTVQIPVIVGRDLMELNMVRSDGKEELHAGGMIFQRIPV